MNKQKLLPNFSVRQALRAWTKLRNSGNLPSVERRCRHGSGRSEPGGRWFPEFPPSYKGECRTRRKPCLQGRSGTRLVRRLGGRATGAPARSFLDPQQPRLQGRTSGSAFRFSRLAATCFLVVSPADGGAVRTLAGIVGCPASHPVLRSVGPFGGERGGGVTRGLPPEGATGITIVAKPLGRLADGVEICGPTLSGDGELCREMC